LLVLFPSIEVLHVNYNTTELWQLWTLRGPSPVFKKKWDESVSQPNCFPSI
jgi:hypothetical protein